jgi:hypothetical protein
MSGNLGDSNSWSHQGLSRAVEGLLYIYHIVYDLAYLGANVNAE